MGAIDAMSKESPMRFPISRERRVVAAITEGSASSGFGGWALSRTTSLSDEEGRGRS